MLLNSVGMMGEVVVLGWLTLTLTNSPFMVGVAMGTRMLPLFFVGVLAGALADRFPRRRLLMLTSGGQALTAATLGALDAAGRRRACGSVLLLTFGGRRAARGRARGAAELHARRRRRRRPDERPGHPRCRHARGWLLGSLGVGAVIAHFGSGFAYFVVAAGFVGGALALLPASVPAARRASAAAGSLWRGSWTSSWRSGVTGRSWCS